jgi:hypothetical protein
VQAAGQIEELKKEVDVRIAAFLKEEAIGQDKVALFNVLQQEVRAAWHALAVLCCSSQQTPLALLQTLYTSALMLRLLELPHYHGMAAV